MKLGNLKSKKVVMAFLRMGFKKISQVGTHIVLKVILNGKIKTLVIPIHKKVIPIGTLTDILNNQAQISREIFFSYY
jgi:predicted RNA binding protein YcfA (HicA-like mRNA interferase family)